MNHSRTHLSSDITIILYRLHHGFLEKSYFLGVFFFLLIGRKTAICNAICFATVRGTNLSEQLTFVSGEKLLLRVFSEVDLQLGDKNPMAPSYFHGGTAGKCLLFGFV